MILPGEIHARAGKEGVRATQIEKDYVISWVMNGIANQSFLRNSLIFKGGTVLKKAYFPHYRFSEDLDFTFYGSEFDTIRIRSAFDEMVDWVYEEARIHLKIKNETRHKTGNYNFYISYTGPLGGEGTHKDIKVDISHDELLYHKPEEKTILSMYSDVQEEEGAILCYPLGEVVAEKMRSVLQRTAPRDLYDLWYLFEQEGLEIEDYAFAFQDKARHKKLEPKEFSDVLNRKKETFAKQWKHHLSHQMTDLPDFDDVWRVMNKHWKKLNKSL